MKTIVMMMAIFAISGLMIYGAVDPVKDQLKDAYVLMMKDKDYAKAQAAYEKIVKDKATTNKSYLCTAQRSIGMTLMRQHDYPAGRAAFQKAINDYPDAPESDIIVAKFLNANSFLWESNYATAITAAQAILPAHPAMSDRQKELIYELLGTSYYRQKEYEAALQEYAKGLALKDNLSAPIQFIMRDKTGDIYRIQRKLSEANAAWMLAIQNGVWEMGAKDEASPVWKTFDKISPKHVTTEAYRAFLDTTIKATKATEDNARFLGKLKSELGKLK